MNNQITSYKIHPATVDDVPSIRQVAVFTWWTIYPSIISAEQIEYMLDVLYNEKTLRKLIDIQEQCFLILSEDEVTEAFAAYGPIENNLEAYKIHKFYILPQKHHMGFGRALITQIVNITKKDGKKYLELNVNRNNPAKGFYEKLGFKVVEDVDIPIGNFWMNDYIMRLDIDTDWQFDSPEF